MPLRLSCVLLFYKFINYFSIFYKASIVSQGGFDDIQQPNAFFVCLVATTKQGFTEKVHYLYDVATEMELQGFRVKFLSVKDIQEFYRKHHPDFKEEEVDIYDLTLFFVEMYKRSSFSFDEVPLIADKHGAFH